MANKKFALMKDAEGCFSFEEISGALAAQTEVISEEMSGQLAAQTFEIREDVADQLADQTKELQASLAASTLETTETTNKRADEIGEKLDGIKKDTEEAKKRNVKYVRKPWFWALEVILFALVAFAMYFFTKNIAMVPQWSEDMLSLTYVVNPGRWIAVGCVALVLPLLLTMTDLGKTPVSVEEDEED